MTIGPLLVRTLVHFFPTFNDWLDDLPDPRDPQRLIYHPRFLLWVGLFLFLGKLGSRRQIDFQLGEAGTWVLANLNRLLGESELVTIGARFGDRAEVELDAQCPTAAAASDFEGSLRAIAVLMKAADSVRVQRDGLRVHASIAASLDSVSRLLH